MNAVSLAGRLAIIMMIAMAIVIAVSIALSQVVWRSMLNDEGLASCEAAAADLSNVIEDNLELGIPLNALSSTQQLIERALRANTAISGISVLDDKGVILFDTEPLRIGQQAPLDWIANGASRAVWPEQWKDGLLGGDLILDSYRHPIGTVIVRYSTVGSQTSLSTGLLKMSRTGVLLLLGTIIVTGGVASLIAREVTSWSRRLQSRVEVAGMPGEPEAAGDLPLLATIQTAGAAVRRTEQDLMRLGMSGGSPT